MNEIWRPIKNYEGCYEVSNLGRVKSLDRIDRIGRLKRGKIKSSVNNGTGYLVVNLKVDGKQKMRTIHRLVAEAFIPNHENKLEVNHKDGDKQNNSVENLEWVNKSENMKHAFENGLSHQLKGVNNPKARLTQSQVDYIKKNYKRYDLEYGFEALGRKFGVSATTIKSIVWGKSYA